ncbi:hypothetical protein PVK06_019838 [Gossypium arboreum]|uniref:Retrovirus-related Pol polyprotein from transposon TNT 1-94-like beta-barrel domain-containing protein n=1 Tax=Gossypium arboreum TaxID=29729 RepID=A0ABR0PL72_GOSAR|nr:hypothetical protein PVK06_019838 [Gossypium arboreum]
MTRSQILNMNPLPSLSRVYAQQLKGYNTNRKSTSSRYLSKLFGEHCKKSRHIKETCFKLHGYPEWCEKGKKSSKPKAANSAQHLEKDEGNTSTVLIVGLTNEQYAQLISMLNLEKSQTSTANFAGKANILSNDNTEWVLDSSTSDHMTSHENCLSSQIVIPHFLAIKIPDGMCVPAKSKGVASFNSHIILKDVLFILSFSCNLISISKLTKDFVAHFFLPFMFYRIYPRGS